MLKPRRFPYLTTTWVSKLLAGDNSCEWAVWQKAHYYVPKRERSDLDSWRIKHTDRVEQARADFASKGYSTLASYHKRSNVETVFSMIKAKFSTRLRSKGDTAQVNEALCKVLCHNICVLIQSMFELGIAPTFCGEIAVVS